jgi:hypothetical protein
MGCMSFVNLYLLINGVASKLFKPMRGLRQGCPLSTLLFLLITKWISKAIMDGKRSGIICNDLARYENMRRITSAKFLFFSRR